jgi:hypothetical protein
LGFGFAIGCIIEVPNSVFDPGDETGFIRLNALRLKLLKL